MLVLKQVVNIAILVPFGQEANASGLDQILLKILTLRSNPKWTRLKYMIAQIDSIPKLFVANIDEVLSVNIQLKVLHKLLQSLVNKGQGAVR